MRIVAFVEEEPDRRASNYVGIVFVVSPREDLVSLQFAT